MAGDGRYAGVFAANAQNANVGSSSTGGVNVPLNGGTAARKPGVGGGAWHPSVAFLMFMIILEYSALLGLRYFFRSVHGG